MHPSTTRWFAVVALALPLRAQTVVSNIFVFEGTIYQQTSSGAPIVHPDPTPHAPGPYYLDVGVVGTGISSAPSFTGPSNGSTLLTLSADPTRWDFKSGFSTAAALTTAYPDGTYSVTVPGFNSGQPVNLALSGSFPGSIPAVIGSSPTWSGGDLIVNANTGATLNFSSFAEYSTSNPTYHYRERLDIAPPTGPSFGQLAVSAFNDPSFTSYTIAPGALTAGDTYRVVLEYDILSDDQTVGGASAWAIRSNQTEFFITAIPEPSTYALCAGLFMLTSVAWRRRRLGRDST
jgi:hypothetical protein